MEQQKLNKIQSFDFFYKKNNYIKKEINSFMVFWIIVAMFLLFVIPEFSSNLISREQSVKIVKSRETISSLSFYQELSFNLENKNWLAVQNHLKKLAC